MQDSERRLKALMVRGLDGDAAAHRELLTQLALLLRAYFARRLGSHASDVEDLVQEVLIAVHIRRGTYDRSQPFTAWSYAIARYKLVDHYRRQRIRVTAPIDDVHGLFVDAGDDAATAGGDLERLMAGLPAKQRAAIRHMKLEGLSAAEAAEKLSMSESAVKVSVHRGLRALAARVRGVE